MAQRQGYQTTHSPNAAASKAHFAPGQHSFFAGRTVKHSGNAIFCNMVAITGWTAGIF
jgi:hypothetical protein